ncbi:unnamed protein product [Arabis nemorensis]|uniref:Uncharacterized protein n=1 Tax=Arabis nemorensis TaxID=586526 RepID=A0A565AMZ4_9BRAS|nr:unnamed protein product [Arabis nemorensis]
MSREREYSVVPFRGDTPEKNPTPARTEVQSPKKEGDLEGLDENKLRISEILDEIQEKASSFYEFSLQWEEMEQKLKERAIEVELKERSLMEQILELEKKEERLKEVEEERERKIGLLEKSIR